MSLLHFPTVLLLFIATFLGTERDINSFSQASNRLHTVVNPYLYRYNSQHTKDSALLWAAEHGNEATARMSIQKGAGIRVTDSAGWTPLPRAAAKGHEAVVKLLLETGQVDVESTFSWNQTPFRSAAGNGHEEVVKLLLETGQVAVDSKDSFSHTPLSQAVGNNNEGVVKLLPETVGGRDSLPP